MSYGRGHMSATHSKVRGDPSLRQEIADSLLSDTLSWDGTDDQGHLAASGVYIYSISTGTSRMSKIVILLK